MQRSARCRRASRLPSKSGAALIGQPIDALFDVDADTLDQYMRGRSARDRILFADGQPCLFASAEPPARRSPHTVRATLSEPRTDLPDSLARLAGEDQTMTRLARRAARFARRDLPVLIQGETGTGKEVMARAVHAARRDPGPFVAVNCAAIPEHLIESELFGYAPNAFTGAARGGKRGLIESANGGTLFLDEIGDMPLALQSRLLRVLAERCVTPVGALESRLVAIHLVSATHAPLADRVAEGAFREDLYYRLNAAVMKLPPLRERADPHEHGLEAQLAECGGNVSELVRRLGVDRSTVHRRLKRLRTR